MQLLYTVYAYVCTYVCRGNFDVQFKHVKVPETSSNVSVFELCYDMTFVMLEKSKQLNKKTGKFIYYRMLWSEYV